MNAAIIKGRLTGVGTGPGDPELLTLKAVRAINEADVIAFFCKKGSSGNGRAIVEAHIRPGTLELPLVYPVTVETQKDETEAATRDVLAQLAGYGATLLEHPVDASPLIAPLVAVYSFYLGVTALAAARGFDADAPVHLRKVTETR